MIGAVLKSATGVECAETFERYGLDYRSARDYRERNLIDFLKAMSWHANPS